MLQKQTSLVLNEEGLIDENQSITTLTIQDANRLQQLLDAKNKYNNLKNPCVDIKLEVNEKIKQNCETKLKYFEDKINMMSKSELKLQKQKHDNELKFLKRKNADELKFLKRKKRIERMGNNINLIFVIIIVMIIGFARYGKKI